ncbi:zinc finger BED domain-containing protein DAYSLEEPER-like [Leptopilina heterotoma]|uniref:zinc finger BED domain-containing protein DAYSLEEPER-like n=1 Tax=Leptopilina heterotoma TaxID=63436 RepID=UPI001CA9E10E|nr:zinc finger BED domain-containing protein DAYSLEEPER-like [Leptopilina heterotoma]
MSENTCVIKRLRGLLKKLKYSEKLREKLKCCCATVEVEILSPTIDIATRWNSSYEMIKLALRMKPALKLLCKLNPDLNKFCLQESEWQLLEGILKYLRYFKTLSLTLSGEKYITIPMVVVGFNMLLDKLQDGINIFDQKIRKSGVEIQIKNALEAATEKILKHYSKFNWMYCAVLLLDPRFKLETFQLTAWGKEMVNESLKKFENIYKESYYKTSTNVTEMFQDDDLSCNQDTPDEDDDDDDLKINSLFRKRNTASVSLNNATNSWRSEIDKYFLLERATEDVDIGQWWKNHENIFPNLSRMAKDLFSIQATSVPAERLFSRAGLIIRKHRNRLTNESAKNLICLNSWMTCNLSDAIIKELNSI